MTDVIERRKAITASMKLDVLREVARVTCYVCLRDWPLADIQFDHVQALIDGGAHAATGKDANIKPICLWCHREKSKVEHKRNAKMKRAKAKHEGTFKTPLRKIPSRPFPKKVKP